MYRDRRLDADQVAARAVVAGDLRAGEPEAASRRQLRLACVAIGAGGGRADDGQAETLDDEGPFGAADAVVWAWFLWNLTYLVGRSGQSWGRKVADLKVVNSDGAPIGFWRSLGRNLFAAFISAPLLYLGFLWVIWDAQKQAWHDKVFRAYMIRRVSG